MTPRLSDEQRDALRQHPDRALYVVDAVTSEQYVLLSAQAYERVQALLSAAEYEPEEFLPLFLEAAAEDIDAPGMELYDQYDANRPKP